MSEGKLSVLIAGNAIAKLVMMFSTYLSKKSKSKRKRKEEKLMIWARLLFLERVESNAIWDLSSGAFIWSFYILVGDTMKLSTTMLVIPA